MRVISTVFLTAVPAILVTVASGGCASTTVETRKLQDVRRAAIVGFESDLNPLTEVFTLDTLFVDLRGPAAMTGEISGQAVKNRLILEDLYERLGRCLAAEFGWALLTIEQVRGTPAYAERKSELDRYVPGALSALKAPEGILWMPQIAQLRQEDFQSLASALGVDALIVAKLDARTAFSGVRDRNSGIGAHRPYFIMHLQVFDLQGDTVWRERWAEGRPTRDSYAEVMGHFDAHDRVPLLVEAFNNSCAALMAQLRSAKRRH